MRFLSRVWFDQFVNYHFVVSSINQSPKCKNFCCKCCQPPSACFILVRLIFEYEHWMFLIVSLTFARVRPLIIVVVVPVRPLWFFDGHANMHRLHFSLCDVMCMMFDRNVNPYSVMEKKRNEVSIYFPNFGILQFTFERSELDLHRQLFQTGSLWTAKKSANMQSTLIKSQ